MPCIWIESTILDHNIYIKLLLLEQVFLSFHSYHIASQNGFYISSSGMMWEVVEKNISKSQGTPDYPVAPSGSSQLIDG